MNNSKTKWLISLMVSALMFTAAGVASAQSNIAVKLSVGRAEITVGDVIPLTLHITHPAGWRVIVPTLDKQWGEFEVRSQSTPTISANGDGTETTSQTIDVARLRPGAVQTPALKVAVADSQGNLHNVEAEPLSLTVQSVLVAGDTRLRDIKPQADLITFQRTYAPVVAVALLTLTAWSVYAIRRRRNRPAADKRTPRQRVQDTLKTLETHNPQTPAEIKAACVDIAVCLRDYVASTTSLSARDLTTNELARQLKLSNLPVDWGTRVIEVLRVCDSVKFANDILELTTIQGLIDMVALLVEQYPPISTSAKQPESKGGLA